MLNRDPSNALVLVALAGVIGLATTACTPSSSPLSAGSAPITATVANAPPEGAARPAQETPRSGRDPQWASIAKSHQAEVLVERALFERPGEPHFFVHVRIVNETASMLGVDLRSYFDVYYPNQWCTSPIPRRVDINEGRLVPEPLDAVARSKLVADFRAGLLAGIPARGSVDYYRDFNASSRADVEAQSRGYRYLIVVMDGRLDVADDADVERILPPQNDSVREVVLDVPVRWAQVPDGAIVLADR